MRRPLSIIPLVALAFLVGCSGLDFQREQKHNACTTDNMYCLPIINVVCEKRIWYGEEDGYDRQLKTEYIPCPND